MTPAYVTKTHDVNTRQHAHVTSGYVTSECEVSLCDDNICDVRIRDAFRIVQLRMEHKHIRPRGTRHRGPSL